VLQHARVKQKQTITDTRQAEHITTAFIQKNYSIYEQAEGWQNDQGSKAPLVHNAH